MITFHKEVLYPVYRKSFLWFKSHGTEIKDNKFKNCLRVRFMFSFDSKFRKTENVREPFKIIITIHRPLLAFQKYVPFMNFEP